MIAQVALSLLLLAGAGLLIKSFTNLSATDPGLDPTRVLTADFVLPRGKYPEPDQQRQFFQRFLPQLVALPGIESSGRRRRCPSPITTAQIRSGSAGGLTPGRAIIPMPRT